MNKKSLRWHYRVIYPQFLGMGKVQGSVVTTTVLSPPLRWLATTEPTPPLQCFTVFSAVCLDAVS